MRFEKNFNGTTFHHHFCLKTGVSRNGLFLEYSDRDTSTLTYIYKSLCRVQSQLSDILSLVTKFKIRDDNRRRKEKQSKFRKKGCQIMIAMEILKSIGTGSDWFVIFQGFKYIIIFKNLEYELSVDFLLTDKVVKFKQD